MNRSWQIASFSTTFTPLIASSVEHVLMIAIRSEKSAKFP
jgi:hypothetical protein